MWENAIASLRHNQGLNYARNYLVYVSAEKTAVKPKPKLLVHKYDRLDHVTLIMHKYDRLGHVTLTIHKYDRLGHVTVIFRPRDLFKMWSYSTRDWNHLRQDEVRNARARKDKKVLWHHPPFMIESPNRSTASSLSIHPLVNSTPVWRCEYDVLSHFSCGIPQ